MKGDQKFKKGQYGDAVKDFLSSVSILEGAVEVFPLFKKDLIQLEAKIYNNIAACHRKESNNELVIKFTTKVIARTKYISDSRVLLKAFLRRGLAYEKQAKFL
jgi:hypothetical protein